MKTSLTSIILMALLCGAGCVSPSKSSYKEIAPAQFEQRLARNESSRDYVWDHWRYAGSDEDYDYIYEYIPGSVIPYGFKFYRLPRGDISIRTRYDFDPDYGDNTLID